LIIDYEQMRFLCIICHQYLNVVKLRVSDCLTNLCEAQLVVYIICCRRVETLIFNR
jgi:hypothetical protein